MWKKKEKLCRAGRKSGSDAEVALDVLEDAVAKTTGALNVAGLERETQALSRGIRFVHGYVAPPDTAVVPQVVVKVVVVDTNRDLGLLRGHFLYVSFKGKGRGSNPADGVRVR